MAGRPKGPRVLQRSDGKGYVAVWNAAGQRQRRSFPTKWQAQQFIAQSDLTNSTSGPSDTPTLGQVFTRWQATQRVSDNRAATDAHIAKRFPPLTDKPIDEITSENVLVWKAKLTDDGLKDRTVGDYLSLLRRVLEFAVQSKIISENPARGIRGPKNQRSKPTRPDVFTVDEIAELVEILPQRWRAMVAFSALMGTRWGEVIALRPADLDMLRRQADVAQVTVQEVDGKVSDKTGGKTEAADRPVPIPPYVADLLAEHLARYPTARKQAIFRTESGNHPHRSNFRRIWKKAERELARRIVERAKATGDEDQIDRAEERADQVLAIPPKNLRHTAATLMLANNVQIMEVAARLGHAKPSMTWDTYARFVPKSGEDAYGAAISVAMERSETAAAEGRSAAR